ncbi:MAG: hypothetical protein Q9180_006042 [Flavoplaca navasiana]
MTEADAAKAKADHEAQHGRALVNEDSASDLNSSAMYKRHYDAFVAAEGKVPFKAKREFFRLRREMEERVLNRTDAIFSTINNLSSRDFEEEGFNAGYIFIDEGGQTSVASLAVALTKFTKFTNFGYIRQRGDALLLNIVDGTYRMAEEITLWPLKIHYERILLHLSTTNLDNALGHSGASNLPGGLWHQG